MINLLKYKLRLLFFVSISLTLISCSNTIKEYWSNGNLKTTVNYLNADKSQYKFCEYFDNGQLKVETTYLNGLLEGDYFQYYRNGKLKLVRRFEKGIIKGIEQSYNNKGEIKCQRVYEDAKLIKEEYYSHK